MPASIVIPPRTVILAALMVLFVTGALLLTFTFAKATITLIPVTQDATAVQSIILSSEAVSPDFVRFILPARLIEESAVQEKTIHRTSQTITEDFATGTVVLHNNQDTDQELLPRTHLRHAQTDVFFLTNNAVRIPAGGTVEVGVTAKEKGSRGNVEGGRFIVDKLSSSMQSVVFAESSSSFSGGQAADDELSETELQTAKEAVLQEAKDSVLGQLTLAAGGEALRDDLTDIQILEHSSSVSAGSRAASFTVRAQVSGRTLLADENDLLRLTLLKLRAGAAPDEELASYSPASFTLNITQADWENKEARVEGSLTGTFTKKIAAGTLSSSNLAGLSTAEAREHFMAFESVADAHIQLFPPWLNSIPGSTGATDITIASHEDQE